MIDPDYLAEQFSNNRWHKWPEPPLDTEAWLLGILGCLLGFAVVWGFLTCLA